MNLTNRIFRCLVLSIFSCALFFHDISNAQANKIDKQNILDCIKTATEFFDENLSVNGGYVWTYSLDRQRRWGEMEAYPSMIWIQGPGTVAMGNCFLDIYSATKDEYYYLLAIKSGDALIKGQLECGGWNYFIDFAGQESTRRWYETIGKNGWRLEEFQHYYGNATFDDYTTTGAAKFLLRLFLVKRNERVWEALNKAIDLILKSQYEIGGWPQRYPPTDTFEKNGNPDYTSYLTMNDGVSWNNTCFLFSCYAVFQDEKFVEPIHRAMNFFLKSLQPKPQSGWALQYTPDLKPVSARTYEPAALDPQYTARYSKALMRFYHLTADKKFLESIPDIIKWIESVRISGNDQFCTVPTFVELGTNQPLYLHRTGSNVKSGKYYFDHEDKNLISHYNSTRVINLAELKSEYEKTLNLELNSPGSDGFIFPKSYSVSTGVERIKIIQDFLEIENEFFFQRPGKDFNMILNIMNQLDENGRWLTKDVFISNPYLEEPEEGNTSANDYTDSRVGDKFDTSPFQNTSDEMYISTALYLRNIRMLLGFIADNNK